MSNPRRIINLKGGTYNERIEGNYIQSQEIDRTRQVKRTGTCRIEKGDTIINLDGGTYYEQLEDDDDVIDV
jgi:hypothetical protein